MGKIIVDNQAYARCVKAMGFRTNASSTSFDLILPEDLEATLKAAAELSMGTEISDTDMSHIHSLCDQVISISEYRTQLSEYLRARMQAIAPNLTALVGELVGARLISHAGSLMNLAKHPASTVQILGAEKALFRALKTKHDTPKYGLIYHASLIGQAPQKLKGKMARMVATKAALSIRVDALSDADSRSDAAASEVGITNRVKLESRLRALEHRAGIQSVRKVTSGTSRPTPKYDMNGGSNGSNANGAYNAGADSVDIKPKVEHIERVQELLPTQPTAALARAVEAVTEVKEEKRDKKKKRKSEVGDVDMEGDDEVKGETKEERRARKEAKKLVRISLSADTRHLGSLLALHSWPDACPMRETVADICRQRQRRPPRARALQARSDLPTQWMATMAKRRRKRRRESPKPHRSARSLSFARSIFFCFCLTSSFWHAA